MQQKLYAKNLSWIYEFKMEKIRVLYPVENTGQLQFSYKEF